LIQIGGRVNRGAESENAEVWDLLLRDESFRWNPALSVSCRALNQFTADELSSMHPTELTTRAMRREWTCGAEDKARQLVKDEENMEYPSVSQKCRVIDTDTRTVIIDEALVLAIREGRKVSRTELMRYSVQIWATKIRDLALEPVIPHEDPSDSDMYSWGSYDYDPDFLGYMAGVLRLKDFIASGEAVI
jgi:hypothetical protein